MNTINRPAESGQLKENKYIFPAPLTCAQYRQQLIDHKLDKNREVFDVTLKLLATIKQAGGTGHIVGGAARDLIMGKIPKDYDVEVFRLPADEIESIVRRFGRVQDAGKAFGILKILHKNMDIDVSLPRTDSKIGVGHGGFHVKTNPFMSFPDAARRRDFTMNSMGWDPLTDQIVDPFGGIKDIRANIIRVTDHERFGDDPLRVYRACQFVSRFNMNIHYKDIPLLKSQLPHLPELSGYRIWEEWSKLLLKSNRPSRGLQTALDLGILEHMHSPLHLLDKTPPDSRRHPEGNVWEHTKLAIDQAAQNLPAGLNPEEKISILLAVLCHDIGEITTTKIGQKICSHLKNLARQSTAKNDRIISPGHENPGEIPVLAFLQSISASNKITGKVKQLVINHKQPTNLFLAFKKQQKEVLSKCIYHGEQVPLAHQLSQIPRVNLNKFQRYNEIKSVGPVRRLVDKLNPATITELIAVAQADHFGRGLLPSAPAASELSPNQYQPASWLEKQSKKVSLQENGKLAAVIPGKDWLKLGLPPGKIIGELIQLSDQLHYRKGVTREQIFSLIEKNGSGSPVSADQIKLNLQTALS